MKDKKLILRVTTKLFAAFALLVIAYVFMQGLLKDENLSADEKTLLLDVSDLNPGEVKYFDYNRRKILALHTNSGKFLVASARDPVFGCPIEWQSSKFVSICNGSEFSSGGKVYSGYATDEDMDILSFEMVSTHQLKIRFE